MYHLLFRSRWFALMWVAGMAAYAVFMTSGGSALMMVPGAAGTENAAFAKRDAERDAEEEKKAKFAEWAAEDRHSSSQSGANNSDYESDVYEGSSN